MTRLVPEWHLRITNFGLGYILLTLLVAIAATNTGNNGLYSVLAGLLAALVVSGVVSRRNIRSVVCSVETLGEVFANRPAALSVQLRNVSRRFTAQGLWFLHEALPGPLFLESLRPGEERKLFLDAVFPRRGSFRSADAGLMSRFPLGIFQKYRSVAIPREILVFPDPLRSAFLQPPEEAVRSGRLFSRLRGFGAGTRTLRDFVAGDDPRDLHWKQSARLQKWIVRERESERSRAVIFIVENAAADPLSLDEIEGIERRISRTAGEALALLSRGGEAGLEAHGASLRPGSGLAQRRALLEALARLEIFPAVQAPPISPPRPGELRREAAA
jgi:uncharacterized protein (DUF58 family)